MSTLIRISNLPSACTSEFSATLDRYEVNHQMSQETSTSRIGYIDIFRSFGIITMVMGHIGYGTAFDHFIHAFHMPMFFWISGFLFNPRSKDTVTFPALVRKKAKSLLCPYLVFGLGHYLLLLCGQIVMGAGIDPQPLLHLLWVNTDGLPICGALWFLTALFFADLLYFLMHKFLPNDWFKTLVIVPLALVGNYAASIFPFTLPYALGPCLVGIGLYHIGYLCRKHGEGKLRSVFQLSWLPSLLLGILTTFLIFRNGYINMRTQTYAAVPFFWVNAILSIIVGVNISRLIWPKLENRRIGKWLVGIGKDSIVYVCLNQIVILACYMAVLITGLPMAVAKILIFAASFWLLQRISKGFMNSKWKVLLGRR